VTQISAETEAGFNIGTPKSAESLEDRPGPASASYPLLSAFLGALAIGVVAYLPLRRIN